MGGAGTGAADSAAVESAPAAEDSAPQAAPPEAAQEDPQAEEEAVEASFNVTHEVYSRTFDEVGAFIRGMNEIIQARDYGRWREHLTLDYAERIGDPKFLEEQSGKPLMRKSGIRLQSAQDYFEQVVVPSRSGANLDDIEFIDGEHVKAISVIRGTRGVLYLLVREDGQWKIGVW